MTINSTTKTIHKPEILELSKQIIKDQEADNIILNALMSQKDNLNNDSSNNQNILATDSDGHIDH
jgi:hypothetical protein